MVLWEGEEFYTVRWLNLQLEKTRRKYSSSLYGLTSASDTKGEHSCNKGGIFVVLLYICLIRDFSSFPVRIALVYVCTSLWSVQLQHDGSTCSLLLKSTGHGGIPVFGGENGESWNMYESLCVCLYTYITSTGSCEALTAFSLNWSSSGICRDLFVYIIQVSMCVDIYKTCTYGCIFKVMYFHMNSFILRDWQGAVSGAAFCWKVSGQEWRPFGHLTSDGVRLRPLRLWTFRLLLSPTYLPFFLILCKRWDTPIKPLVVGEHDSVFTSGHPWNIASIP